MLVREKPNGPPGNTVPPKDPSTTFWRQRVMSFFRSFSAKIRQIRPETNHSLFWLSGAPKGPSFFRDNVWRQRSRLFWLPEEGRRRRRMSREEGKDNEEEKEKRVEEEEEKSSFAEEANLDELARECVEDSSLLETVEACQKGREPHRRKNRPLFQRYSSWEERYNELEQFFERNRHFDVRPEPYETDDGVEKDGKALSRWISMQRSQRKQGILKDERFQKLDQIGFPWRVEKRRRNNNKKIEPKRSGEERAVEEDEITRIRKRQRKDDKDPGGGSGDGIAAA